MFNVILLFFIYFDFNDKILTLGQVLCNFVSTLTIYDIIFSNRLT